MNYLPHDHLTAVDDGAWPLAYEYDLQDRLITEHQGWATLRYQYNALASSAKNDAVQANVTTTTTPSAEASI